MDKQYDRGRGLRVFFSCVLGMLVLLIMGGSRAAGMTGGPSTASLSSPLKEDIDLCAFFPQEEGIKIEPGIEQFGGKFQSCHVVDDRSGDKHTFFQFNVSRYNSVQEARASIKYYDYANIPPGQFGQKWVATSAFGDPGYAFEMAAVPPSDPNNPSNTQVSAKVIFARGAYVVDGDAGWKSDANFTLNDASEMEAIAARVNGGLPAGPSDPDAEPTATATATPITQDGDLCALLKRFAGNEPVRLAPGVGQPGALQSCIMDYATGDSNAKFGSIILSNRSSVDTAHKEVEESSKLENWGVKFYVPTSSYGDPGYGYDLPGIPNPDPDPRVHGKPTSAGLLFARGCYVASGYAGANGQALDPSTMRTILAGADQALQQPPFSLCAAVITSTLDLTVGHIEVVQVVQDENNNAQTYAGKETLVRVFVGVEGATTPVPGVEVELRAFPAGNDVGVVILARNTPFTAPLNPSRAVLTDSVNFDVPLDLLTSSTYPIKVTINPNKTISETTYDNNDLTKQLKFVEPDLFRIGYVRIGYTLPGSANVIWPTGPLQTYTSTLVNIYPIDGTHLQYYELPNRLVYTGTLTGLDNKVALRNWLRLRYDRLRSRRGEAAPDIVVGYLAWQGFGPTNVFTDAVGIAEIGTYAGEQLSGGPAPNVLGRVAWVIDYNGGGGPDSSPRVLAHEVGHVLTLHHPGTNDTGPGSPCWGATINTFPGYWSRGTGQTWEIGYDHVTRNLRPDTDYDIMNYCAANLNWISMLDYKRLFDAMRRYNFEDPDLKPDLAWDDFLVSGSLARDGSSGSLDPLYRDTSSGKSATTPSYASYQSSTVASSNSLPAQQEQGENCLRFTGASGTITEHCFDVSFFEEETAQQLDQARFSLRIPYPQGATGVELVRKGNVVAKRIASTNSPTLNITSPKAGDSWDGSQTITWDASDSDGDSLTYEVHYSPNGGQDWFPLELGLQTPQYAINTSDIAGGDNVLLRVLASDGFNTTQASVGPIKVPNSPPWEPPALPGTNPPQTQPVQPEAGSGSNALLFTLLGFGIALLVGAILVGSIVIMRRPRAWQGQGGYPYPPNSYPPTYAPPTTQQSLPQQGPRVAPPPPQPAPPVQRPPIAPTATPTAPQSTAQKPLVPPAPRPPAPGTPRAPGAASVPTIPGNPFSSAQAEYTRLKGELAAGRINLQQFESIISQIKVTDSQGRSWMLSTATGQWLVYDGRAWVPGKPL